MDLKQQRCLIHVEREAAVRCPECGGFFCRECVTEHDDRLICASCLLRLARGAGAGARRWPWVRAGVQLLLAVLFGAGLFYLAGEFLLRHGDTSPPAAVEAQE